MNKGQEKENSSRGVTNKKLTYSTGATTGPADKVATRSAGLAALGTFDLALGSDDAIDRQHGFLVFGLDQVRAITRIRTTSTHMKSYLIILGGISKSSPPPRGSRPRRVRDIVDIVDSVET